MDYRLHHFGIVCQDVGRSLTVYREPLTNLLTSRWYNRSLVDIAFVGCGSDGTLELVGPPHLDYEEKHVARYGHSINHVAYLVDDADAAFEELKAQGVEVAWEPQDVHYMLSVRQCAFRDEDGLLFEVFHHISPLPMATPDVSGPFGPTDLRLHHVSILTPDLRRGERFYAEKLGLTTVLEYTEDDGGFLFMIDPYFDSQSHNLMLELIGPPYLEPREEVLLDKYGACYDHLCYVADDVKGAWRAAVERGGKADDEPRYYDEYGMTLGWLKDADGVDVEILEPVSDEMIKEALQGGRAINIAQARS